MFTVKKAKRVYFHARAIESSTRAGQIFLGRTKGMTIAAIIKGKTYFMPDDLKEANVIKLRSIKATIGVVIMLRPQVSFTGNFSNQ
jgi:hypothetical protein